MSLNISAQSLEQELGYIYVKADYMLETSRYDEAIKEFTKIIAKDPAFKDVLYKRGYAKFNVGAFEGTKNDLLASFDTKGVTNESLTLFGKNQKNLGNYEASEVTLATAECSKSNSSNTTRGNTDKGTSSEEDTSEVKKIEDKISSILDDILGKKDADNNEPQSSDNERSTEPTTTSTQTTNDNNNDNPPSDGGTIKDNTRVIIDGGSTTTQAPEADPVQEEDTSVNEIYIDEDVTLEIKNGLGNRKVLQQPSILILSETSGIVTIDVCVNKNGKVETAEFDTQNSTLKTESLISLAVRKSKEFWFARDNWDETCGTIIFKITGS